MNCSQFENVVHDLERAGAVSEPLWGEALGHADGCAQCAVLLDQVRTLNRGLRELAEEERGLQAPVRVETALRAVYRQRRAMEVHARAWRRWIWAGAAAVIAAGVVTALALRRDNKSVTPTAVHVPAQANPSVLQPATANQPQQLAQDVRTQESGQSRKPRGVAHRSEAESAEEFIPLPDSLPLLPAEETSVVRVQLPRGALSAFGLSVNEERAADLIQVDFLVAEDGTPRAVRYVR